ncbi:predicted protein [Botrytis cinerea T4]|uniref:Uncharacterized protein n=1 Tax=Botryotinia fuckeliana (strain T4) TaxID=999810 RepID=G2YCE2_BOTF4|nr:predicted protein [Botrytis cinerea T4]
MFLQFLCAKADAFDNLVPVNIDLVELNGDSKITTVVSCKEVSLLISTSTDGLMSGQLGM